MVTAFLTRFLRALCRIRLHRRSGRAARRHLRRADRLERCCAISGRIFSRRRRDQGPARQRSDRQRSTTSSAGHFFPDRDKAATTRATARACEQRPARPEARQVRRLHRLLELSGMPLSPAGSASRATPMAALGRHLDGPKLLGIDPVSGQAGHPAQGPYGHYVQLGEAERQGEAQAARCRAADARRGRSRPRAGAAGAAARGRAASGRRRADHGRHRPLRSLPEARRRLQVARRDDDVLDIGLNRAVALLAEAKAGGRGAARRSRCDVGNHPADEAPIDPA